MPLPDLTAQNGDTIAGEPVEISDQSAPDVVMRAVGFDPARVQSVVVTAHGIVAVAADYPGTDLAPEPAPEEDPDAAA